MATQTFGTLLRDLRKRSGMTQDELALRLGYSRQMISALETDERLPDLDAVEQRFATALGVDESRQLTDRLLELALIARRKSRLAGLGHPHRHRTVDHADSRADISPRQFATHIPASVTPLFGREREIERLCDRLLQESVRLLTLVGPPGVGKTRLAQAVGTRLVFTCTDGGCFVPLAGVTDPEHVASSILAALEVSSVNGAPLPALVSHLRRREMVLVLDNFDQILPAGPQLSHLLSECPGVRIIVTSRERLRLRSENTARVPPLDLQSAVELFLERARAAGADLSVNSGEHAHIEAICRRLDCLPLAIELCAAQADYLSTEQLLAQLQTRPLDALADGASDLPPHQRTLRTAISRSYEMLSDDEASLLRALSVFAGGCRPEMAVTVWGGDDAEKASRFDATVRGLVAKNLVQTEMTALGERRLLLLESIREFGRERLEEAGVVDDARARHFDACMRFGRQVERGVWGVDSAIWVKRFTRETDNADAAFRWAYENERWEELAILLILYWIPYFDTGARLTECLDWMDRLFPLTPRLTPDVELAFKVLYMQVARGESGRERVRSIAAEFRALVDACQSPGVKADSIRFGVEFGVYYPNDLEAMYEGVACARAAIAAGEEEHPIGFNYTGTAALTQALKHVGIHLVNGGEGIESDRVLREVLALEREHGFKMDIPIVLWFLGRAALIRGEDKLALSLFEETLAVAIDSGSARYTLLARAFMGLSMLYLGDFDAAEDALRQARDEANTLGDPYCMGIPTLMLTELALTKGEWEEAHNWFAENVAAAFQSVRDLPWQQIHRMLLGARLAAVDGNNMLAATLYGAALTLNDRTNLGPAGPIRNMAAPALENVRTRLGEESWQNAFTQGSQLSRDEVLRACASLATHE